MYSPDGVACLPCISGSYSNLSSQSSCSTCAPGRYSSVNTSLSTCSACAVGKFGVLSGQSSCNPCQKGFSAGTSGRTVCLICDLNSYSQVEGQSACSNCPMNSRNLNSGSQTVQDCACRPGYFGKAFQGEDCVICNNAQGLTCAENASYPSLASGLFRSPNNPNIALYCTPPEACVASSSETLNTKCSEGYTGYLCGSCLPLAFFRQGVKCVSCPSKVSTILTTILFLILCLIVLLIAVKRGVKISIEVKMIVFWMQIIATYPNLSSSWPGQVLKLFGIISVSNLDLEMASPGKNRTDSLLF
jgi:hypothetical protein